MSDLRIQWSEALAVGLPAVDADHQQLFALCGEVVSAVSAGRGASVVEGALDALGEYARVHFEREESILAESGYPQLAMHARQHARLLGQLREIKAEAQSPEAAGRIARLLQTWLLDHILVADMDYAHFLNERRRAQTNQREKGRVLVVEDSRFFATMLSEEIRSVTGLKVDCAASIAEARAALRAKGGTYVAAVCDLMLPDSREAEATELCREAGVPAIVFTGTFSEDLRERLTSGGVIDYILKDNPSSVSQLTALVSRLVRNRGVKAMVVDDSRNGREYITALLERYNFAVLTAGDGEEALALLSRNPDVRLVVTDYHMPKMDGIEMTRRMRATHSKEKLAIVGLSSGGGTALSARFLKTGANDFLTRPFLREEFFFRISQNMELLDLMSSLKDAAIRDYLTGLFNRRYFYDVGQTLFASMARGAISLTAAVIDIDFFKKVNDAHGHEAGDQALKAVARCLRSHIRESDVIARFGGEEFAFLAVNVQAPSVREFFDRLRVAVEAVDFTVAGKPVPLTVSIGVHHGPAASLEEMMAKADAMLYRAKNSGRNRVEVGRTGGD